MPEDSSAPSAAVSDLSTRTELDLSGSTGLPAWLNVSEASRYFGITRQSLYRKIRKGQVHGAKRVAEEGWLLPLDGLFDAGLRPITSGEQRTSDLSAAVSDLSTSQAEDVSAPVRQLEAELVTWRERALVAEAEARERAQRIDDLRLSLRALAVGPAQPAGGPGSGSEPAPTQAPRRAGERHRRRWPWQR